MKFIKHAILALLLLLAGTAEGVVVKFVGQVPIKSPQIASGTTISVTVYGTGAAASLTQDNGAAIANPMRCDTYGVFQFNVTPGTYTMTITRPDGTVSTFTKVPIGIPGEIVSADLVTALTTPPPIGGTTPNTGAFTTISVTGQITSTLATGSAPLVVASTTLVANLYAARAALADGVTTNANLTGPITSVGNATSIASQTGTGTKFVVDNGPTLIAPILGAATGTSLSVSGQFTSTVATGTAPLVVASTTNVANLNASSLSGATMSAPGAIGGGTPSTGAFTTLSASGVITSTLATGTAPFTVASTTNVANLNASSLSGATFAAPGAIGGGTPAAITGTAITGSSITNSSLTSGRVALVSTAGLMADSAQLTLNTTNANFVVGDGATNGTTAALDGPTSTNRNLTFRTAGSNRWIFNINGTPESGSNAGSNFALIAYDDSAVQIDSPLTIARVAAGVATWNRPVTIAGSNAFKVSGLTSGRVTTATTSGQLTDSAALLWASSANLTVGDGVTASDYTFNLDSAAARNRDINFRTAGTLRWVWRINSTAEAGSNAGSNLQLLARADDGTAIDTPITINRVAAGAMTISRPTTVNAALACGTGTLSASNGAISQTITDAVTSAATTCLTLAHGSSGTPAANFGSQIQFNGHDDGNTNRNMGQIRSLWTTATSASRASKMDFYTYAIGVATLNLSLTSTSAAFQAGIPLTTNDTTEASAVGTASVVHVGGLGVAKRSFLGTIGSTFKGNVDAGVQDGTAASAGQVGEVLSSVVSTYTNYTTTGTIQNLTSIALTPGDWMEYATITFYGNSATNATDGEFVSYLCDTTASATGAVEGETLVYGDEPPTGTLHRTVTISYHENISASKTKYLNGKAAFTVGNPQFACSLKAVRIR